MQQPQCTNKKSTYTTQNQKILQKLTQDFYFCQDTCSHEDYFRTFILVRHVYMLPKHRFQKEIKISQN